MCSTSYILLYDILMYDAIICCSHFDVNNMAIMFSYVILSGEKEICHFFNRYYGVIKSCITYET